MKGVMWIAVKKDFNENSMIIMFGLMKAYEKRIRWYSASILDNSCIYFC